MKKYIYSTVYGHTATKGAREKDWERGMGGMSLAIVLCAYRKIKKLLFIHAPELLYVKENAKN